MKIIDYSIREGEPLDKFNNVTDLGTEFVSIVEAVNILGVRHDTYVRKLLLEGRLEGIKIQMKGYQKWYISRASCSHYIEHIGRARQPRRYVLRTEATNERAIRAALDKLEIHYTLELAYNGDK